MCGIYGIVEFEPDRSKPSSLIANMGRSIIHRGPDDEGTYFGPGIAMGMRRLSIIDLAGGHQPIPNEDQSIWVICNGEIYNFHELRGELESKGHRFRTGSDTEILVHLYEEEGLEFVKHLRGMFGFALWDAGRSRLVLGRDRLGKKPLYVRREPHRLLFASELKAILQDETVPRTLSLKALDEYLALGYVPAPMTLLDGIEKVLPGHYLVVENGTIVDREYWELDYTHVESRSEEEWIELIRDKLLEAVRIRLVSDVPLGAFLSGGLDSSAIVAAMARSSDQAVKTYSIGFEGEDRFYNELPFARLVADAYATDHHEIIVRPQLTELLPKLVWHLDEPIADSASLTTYLVSELACRSVTVILSGVGGDELFGGYRRYLGNELLKYYQVLPTPVRAAIRTGLAHLPQDRHSLLASYVRYAAAFTSTAELSPAARYMSYVTLFSPEARRSLELARPSGRLKDGTGPVSAVMSPYFERVPSEDWLAQMMYVDMKTSLPDDLLALTDRMTMAASLECRAPFMDHELVELAARIPSRLKVRGMSLKYLLKKAVAPWLPREVVHRKKRGFGAPIGAWLRNSLDGLLQDTLSEERIKKRGLFDWRVIKSIFERHCGRTIDYTDHLLALITFELWCQTYLDGGDRNFVGAPVTAHSDHR
jgi:asparagine synthase (glutamine-hydrolysing)